MRWFTVQCVDHTVKYCTLLCIAVYYCVNALYGARVLGATASTAPHLLSSMRQACVCAATRHPHRAADQDGATLVDTEAALVVLCARVLQGLGDGRRGGLETASAALDDAANALWALVPVPPSPPPRLLHVALDALSETPSHSLAVGVDCEWQPFDRGQPSTPVSILQVGVLGLMRTLTCIIPRRKSVPL